jgi:hypothetical protein
VCPLLLPSGCRGQMCEERPATGQGFFSRVFFGDDRSEGRRMTTRGFPVPLRSPISRSGLRGRSPP